MVTEPRLGHLNPLPSLGLWAGLCVSCHGELLLPDSALQRVGVLFQDRGTGVVPAPNRHSEVWLPKQKPKTMSKSPRVHPVSSRKPAPSPLAPVTGRCAVAQRETFAFQSSKKKTKLNLQSWSVLRALYYVKKKKKKLQNKAR